MAIVKKTQPYEFLARWDENTGAFKAYHFKTITRIVDDATGEVIAAKEDQAMNVAQATDAGFPINDILDKLTTDALAAADVAKAA